MIQNDFENKEIQIHWFRPTLRTQHKERNAFHKMHYEGDYTEVVAKNQQKGRRRITRDARSDTIQYDSVHFGFNKLTPTGGKQETTSCPFF